MNFLFRCASGTLLCSVLTVSASAQYGGGSGTSSNGGYSSATGIGIGAAAAAGIAVAYLALHKSSVTGCVAPSADGIKLMNEKDKKTYALLGTDALGKPVRPGERVELKGKRIKSDAGGNGGSPAFRVLKLARDFGPCEGESTSGMSSVSH